MKAVCFNFEIHQPFRLKRYRFFDIGNDHYYYDDFLTTTSPNASCIRATYPQLKPSCA